MEKVIWLIVHVLLFWGGRGGKGEGVFSRLSFFSILITWRTFATVILSVDPPDVRKWRAQRRRLGNPDSRFLAGIVACVAYRMKKEESSSLDPVEFCRQRISKVQEEWTANSFATVLHTLTNRPDNENNFRPWPSYGALAGALNGWYCVPSHRAPYHPGFLEGRGGGEKRGGGGAAWREARAP